MKAMGAEVRDILLLTMGESALMGILGGIIGIAGGSIFIYFMNEYLATMGTVLFAVTYRLMAISLIFATFLARFQASTCLQSCKNETNGGNEIWLNQYFA